MTNSQRFHKSKKLIREARLLLEPINDELSKEHEEKYKLRYSDNDPLPPDWEYCQQISHARNRVISMICDLKELEQESIAIPI